MQSIYPPHPSAKALPTGKKPLLTAVSEVLTLPRLPVPHHLSTLLQSTLTVFEPQTPAWQEPSPGKQVLLRSKASPWCPQPAHARLAPETQLRVTDKYPPSQEDSCFGFLNTVSIVQEINDVVETYGIFSSGL